MKEMIPGGLAQGAPDSSFDPIELLRGIKVEFEHTSNFDIAKEIAKDHLVEDKKYYQKLEKMEENPKYKRCPRGMEVQAVLLDKEYHNEESAKYWVKTHGFLAGEMEETKNFFRFTQSDPQNFVKSSYKTISFSEDVKVAIARPLPGKEIDKAKKNFSEPEIDERIIDHYEKFHGEKPTVYSFKEDVFIPGKMVCMGEAKETEYHILDRKSNKNGRYYHEFLDGVKIYRPAQRNDTPDLEYDNFPMDLMVLGGWPGAEYEDKKDKETYWIYGETNEKLCVHPDRKTLVVVNEDSGVEYIITGGGMRVDDWIRERNE